MVPANIRSRSALSAGLMMVSAFASGCVGGTARQENGSVNTNAFVFARTCPTCDWTSNAQFTDQNGFWDFNSYAGEENVLPTNGEEATEFVLCDLSSGCVDMFHRPQWVNVAEEGQEPLLVSGTVDAYFQTSFTGDTDGDTLFDSVEIGVYGTDPNLKDTDGDGIGDGAEVQGWNWVDYPSHGANPLHMDVFVEVDYVEYTDETGLHTWKLSDAVIAKIESLYASLTNSNPDGTTGINVHIVQDTVLPKNTPCDDRDDWLPNDAPFNPHRAEDFGMPRFAIHVPPIRTMLEVRPLLGSS